MTEREFQHRYHEYQTYDRDEAQEEARMVNAEGIDGDYAVAVHLGEMGYVLMLSTPAMFMASLDPSVLVLTPRATRKEQD